MNNTAQQQGILDKIIGTKHDTVLKNFSAPDIALKILSHLKERDRTIMAKRFGLLGFSPRTLEAIGKDHKLTRERVRQIEKESLKFLRTKMGDEELVEAVKALSQIVNDCGRIIREVDLIKTLSSPAATDEERNSILFILNVAEELLEVREDEVHHAAWASVVYSHEVFQSIIQSAKEILKSEKKPIRQAALIEKIQQTKLYQDHQSELNEKIVRNYLELSRDIERNPFDEYGLSTWNEITPKDVGDKAFILLKHHGKPEHYVTITKMINDHGFDKRVAHKETVHNELIKDPRFVLVGRGMYALTEWGFARGVVSDVIANVLRASKTPMSREQVIDEVLKSRFVKRNTVLVALSNKALFTKSFQRPLPGFSHERKVTSRAARATTKTKTTFHCLTSPQSYPAPLPQCSASGGLFLFTVAGSCSSPCSAGCTTTSTWTTSRASLSPARSQCACTFASSVRTSRACSRLNRFSRRCTPSTPASPLRRKI